MKMEGWNVDALTSCRDGSLVVREMANDGSCPQSHSSLIRIHHWVLWWLYLGVACGVAAVVNIVFGNPSRLQEAIILILGVLFWCLGGLVCWAFDGIRVEKEAPPARKLEPLVINARDREWRSASEFRLPGTGKALLRFPYKRRSSQETLAHYGLHYRGNIDQLGPKWFAGPPATGIRP
jgi:hypothetical protein